MRCKTCGADGVPDGSRFCPSCGAMQLAAATHVGGTLDFSELIDKRTQGFVGRDSVRVGEVEAGGKVLGAEVGEQLAGKLVVNVVASGTVYGSVVGATWDRFSGGKAKVDVEVDTVGKGGEVVGARLDELGFGD